MNKYDLYIGKSLYCCCGYDCGKTYEVISDVYEEGDYEYFDIKDDETGEVKRVDVDFLCEYSEY